MESTSPSSSPPLLLALLLWVATLGLGAVLLASWVFFHHKEPNSTLEDSLSITLVCTAFAAMLSAPVLLVLPVTLRWAVSADMLFRRRSRTLLVIGSLVGLAAFCSYWILTEGNQHFGEAELLWLAAPYLPAALLAAAFVYRPWLFRP